MRTKNFVTLQHKNVDWYTHIVETQNWPLSYMQHGNNKPNTSNKGNDYKMLPLFQSTILALHQVNHF
jgi:hypothetical protein